MNAENHHREETLKENREWTRIDANKASLFAFRAGSPFLGVDETVSESSMRHEGLSLDNPRPDQDQNLFASISVHSRLRFSYGLT
jgi:hypothetical protein